jgi:DNA-binding transcriptional LysR family regulator
VIGGAAPLDLALRLKRFREEHPDIEIILRGPWEAVIPEPDGHRIVIRWELRDLLDEVEMRLAARQGPGVT